MERFPASRPLARLLAILIVGTATVTSVGGSSHASPNPSGRPESPYGTTMVVDGHGNGHGIGLGQYGALGYAVDAGWTAGQILDHYYGGTTPGTIANDAITVRLTALDEQQTAVVAPTHQALTTADGQAAGWTSIVARPDPATGGYQVYGNLEGQVCPAATADLSTDAAWTRLPDQPAVSGGVTVVTMSIVGGTTDSTPASALLGLCEPGGTVRSYRGTLSARTGTGGEHRTVNEVPIETYLRGVVPSEMSAGWAALGGGKGAQALQAQAVAARSYAAAQSRYPSYATKTCDSQSCQVYGGAARRTGVSGGITSVEQASSDAAIGATAGMVRRTSGGAVASTMFSSSTGGYTAGSGFTAVPDDGDDVSVIKNPYHDWSTTLSVPAIEAKYPSIGLLTQASVTQRNGLGADGGRVVQMVLIGTAGRVTISGDDFRLAMQLRSNWFSVRGDQCSGRIEPPVGSTSVPTTAVGFVPVQPVRVIDTRNAIGTAAVELGGGCTLAFDPGTRPVGTIAAAVVVTTTGSDTSGFTTVSPCGAARPEVSAVQLLARLDVPGTTVVPLGDGGRICLYTSATTEVIVDVMGWFAPSGAPFRATTTPQRLLDSRQPPVQPRIATGTVTKVQIPTLGSSVPAAASINLTATAADESGYVTAYPCDGPRPNTSVLNFRSGADVADHVLVDLDATGAVCLWNSSPVHLIADLDGVFGEDPVASLLRMQLPVRMIDTRTNVGTVGKLAAGERREFDLGTSSAGVLAEITVVDPAAAGYLSMYPCDSPQSGAETSVINAPRGTNVANLVLMRTDAEGRVCVYSSSATQLLIDVIGRV